MPPPLLLLLVPLLALLVGSGAVAMDVTAQLQLLSGPLPAPAAPATLNTRLERALGGASLSSLSSELQRALLWDAGWLRLADGGSEYVQVLVPCGSHMDAAVLGDSQVDGCVAESECRRPSGNASAWNCEDAGQVARCAVVVGEAQLETASYASWPLVAVDTVIDESFDPQLLRFTGGGDQDQFVVIASRGEWRTQGAFCLQGPLFVSPCVVFNTTTSSSTSSSASTSSSTDSSFNLVGWCEPEPSSAVSAWLQEELAGLEQQVASTPSTSDSSSSDRSEDTPLLIGMIVAGFALVAIISIPFCLAHRNQRLSRQQMTAPTRHRYRNDAIPSRSQPDQSISTSDFHLLMDR